MEPDLDAIERQLAEAESTLDRLDDGSYWTDATGIVDRLGDASDDATPVYRPPPAPTDR